MERHPGKFVWFELLTSESRRAQAFYGAVLGWKVQPFPIGSGQTYEMIHAGDAMIGAYASPRRPGEPSRWIAFASVTDVDRTVAEALSGGGTVVEPSHDIPGVGRRAGLLDPLGAEFSLFRSLMGDPPDVQAVPEGRWLWNELHVPDPGRGLAFYRRVLGFEQSGLRRRRRRAVLRPLAGGSWIGAASPAPAAGRHRPTGCRTCMSRTWTERSSEHAGPGPSCGWSRTFPAWAGSPCWSIRSAR